MATTITIEDVKKAKSYMPIAQKESIAALMAKLCVRSEKNDAVDSSVPLPPVRVEDRAMRLQCLHGVLAGWYFGGEYEKEKLRWKDKDGATQEREIAMCMSAEALDSWLEGHPMNQLERLKKEKAVANKVYDILYDFRAFELMLNGAIRDELDMANDPALRIAQVMAVQTTPEQLKETMAILKEYQKEAGVKENA